MTERFGEWLFLLEHRDWVLAQFAGIAFWSVVIWESIRLWPEPTRPWLRRTFMLCSLGVFYVVLVA